MLATLLRHATAYQHRACVRNSAMFSFKLLDYRWLVAYMHAGVNVIYPLTQQWQQRQSAVACVSRQLQLLVGGYIC